MSYFLGVECGKSYTVIESKLELLIFKSGSNSPTQYSNRVNSTPTRPEQRDNEMQRKHTNTESHAGKNKKCQRIEDGRSKLRRW